MQYTQTGTYIALTGLAIFGLAKLGVHVDQNFFDQLTTTVINTINDVAGLITIFGVAYQAIAHRNLAVEAGRIGYVKGINA